MKSIRLARRHSSGPEINMAPLIDMIFILLIFFVVTTSFVRESGIEVKRPVAQTAKSIHRSNLLIGVTSNGGVYIEGRRVNVMALRPVLERFLATSPNGSVVIVADKDSYTGIVVQILDQCRLAGVKRVSIAAKRPSST